MKELKKKINTEFSEISRAINVLTDNNLRNFKKLISESKKKLKSNKIIFCGNGGSASHAQHLACELVVRYAKERKAISAISLTTDTSILTATGNDYSFDKIFSRQIEANGNKGDICIFLTTSGNSRNLIEAAKLAKKKSLSCYAISGKGGGKLKNIVKNNIIVSSNVTSSIQSVHLILGHVYCQELENFSKKK